MGIPTRTSPEEECTFPKTVSKTNFSANQSFWELGAFVKDLPLYQTHTVPHRSTWRQHAHPKLLRQSPEWWTFLILKPCLLQCHNAKFSSNAWGRPQFQEERSRTGKAILRAIGEFCGILRAWARNRTCENKTLTTTAKPQHLPASNREIMTSASYFRSGQDLYS